MTSQPPQPPGGYGRRPGEDEGEPHPDGRRAEPGPAHPGYGPPPSAGTPAQGYGSYGQPPYGHPAYHEPLYDQPGHEQWPYGQQPGYGAHHPQPYGQPPWGRPGPGAAPCGQQSSWGQPSGAQSPAQQPWAPPSRSGPQVGLDRRRLGRGDWLVALCAVAFVLFAALPWFTFDFGLGFAESINGFDFLLVTISAVLLVLAAVWSLLPAVVDLGLPFPRGSVTVGLTSPALLLTLVEWLTTFEGGFSLFALLTVLTAAAAVAVRTLVRQPHGSVGAAPAGTGRPTPQP